MQVLFLRWCVDPKGRNPVSVNTDHVLSTEPFSDAYTAPDGTPFPAATYIYLRGNREYIVQGTHDEIVTKLNPI